MGDASVKKFYFTWTLLLASFSSCLTEISGKRYPGRNFNPQPMGFFGGNPNPFQQQPMFPNQGIPGNYYGQPWNGGFLGNPGNFGQPGGFGNPNFGGNFPSQNQFQNFGNPGAPNQFPNNFNNGQQPFGQSGFPNNGGQAFPPGINRQPTQQPQQEVNGGPGQPGLGPRNPSNDQNRPQPNRGPSDLNNENPINGQYTPQPNQGQDNFPNSNPEGRYPNNNNPSGQNVPNNPGQHQNRPSAPVPDYGWNNPGNSGNPQNVNKNNGGQNQGPSNFPNQPNNPHNNFDNGHGPEIYKPVNHGPNTGTPNQQNKYTQTRDPPIDVRHETEKNEKANQNLKGPNTQQNNNGGQPLRKDAGVKKQETKAWTYYDENNTENDADLDLIELTKQGS